MTTASPELVEIPNGLRTDRLDSPYPMHRLRRVDRPTTTITDQVASFRRARARLLRALRGRLRSSAATRVPAFRRQVPAVGGDEGRRAPSGRGGRWSGRRGHERRCPTTRCPQPAHQAGGALHARRRRGHLRAAPLRRLLIRQERRRRRAGTHPRHRRPGRPGLPSFEAASGRDWLSNSQSFRSYSATALISCMLADYIRRLGYSARAHHSMDYKVVVPPILMMAGLGEICRIGGIVLHPFMGPRFKAAVVTTDLPLHPDRPIDFGLQDFCDACKKCARECPSGSITDGPEDHVQRLRDLAERHRLVRALPGHQRPRRELRPVHQGVPVEQGRHLVSLGGHQARGPVEPGPTRTHPARRPCSATARRIPAASGGSTWRRSTAA